MNKIFLNKKTLISLFALVAIMCLSSYFIIFKNKITKNGNILPLISNKKEALETKEERSADVKKFDSAKATGKPAQCAEIRDEYTRDLCFQQVAMSTKDYAACNQIINEKTKNVCIFVVIRNKAIEEKNSELCKKIEIKDFMDRCEKAVKIPPILPAEKDR
jgi:hypothetical protein